MTFLADEGVDAHVVTALRRAGFQVVYVAELSPGITDPEVLKLASDSDALLISTDKDFGELIYRQGAASRGIILLRLAGLPADLKAATVLAVVQLHGDELPGAFTVITDRAVRIRRLDRV